MFLGTRSFLPKPPLRLLLSFKPFWSSDGEVDTTRVKRRLDLPQNRQETSSGASAAADGGSPFRVADRGDSTRTATHFNHPKSYGNWV